MASRIVLPFPHTGQRIVRQRARRFNVLAAGRRWRKTTLCMSIVVEAAMNGGEYLWTAPTYDQVRTCWNETQRACRRAAQFNRGTMTVTFPGGGVIQYRSLDDPDNVRSKTADGVLIDEAGDVAPHAWYEVLRPMLIDTKGWAWLIGTPKGRNWFYQEFLNAERRSDGMAVTAPTLGAKITAQGLVREPHPLENPNIDWGEVVNLYQTMPERSFRQEILGEFIESEGVVFRRVRQATRTRPGECVYNEDHTYVMGVDWGREQDYTVMAVYDATAGQMVELDRMSGIEYAIQEQRLIALARWWNCTAILAESNAMGLPIIEQLQRKDLPVVAFTTTNATKAVLVDGMVLALEQDRINLLDDPALIAEMEAYEGVRLPSGLIRYSAPARMHDDIVMATMLGWHAANLYGSSLFAWGIE